MDNTEEKQIYTTIGIARLLNIEVILDGEKVYEGKIENAPEQIKELRYSKAELVKKMTYYAYSELNKKEVVK